MQFYLHLLLHIPFSGMGQICIRTGDNFISLVSTHEIFISCMISPEYWVPDFVCHSSYIRWRNRHTGKGKPNRLGYTINPRCCLWSGEENNYGKKSLTMTPHYTDQEMLLVGWEEGHYNREHHNPFHFILNRAWSFLVQALLKTILFFIWVIIN